MLRSFLDLCRTAEASAVIAAGDGRAALRGGGNGYTKPWHWHDCLMLILPTIGALDMSLEDRPSGTWISEDRFVVVPANRAHRTKALRDNHLHVAVYVTNDALRGIESELGSLNRVRRQVRSSATFQVTPEIRVLQNLCRAGHADEFARPLVRRYLSSALLVQCLAQIEHSKPLSDASHRGHGAMLVSEMKAYIAVHLGEDISLDAMADGFGVSRRHLTRLFREHTGASIGKFQQTERMAAACKLLAETDLSVGEIAFRTGFESGSALTRAMRRSHGQTPTGVRLMVARSV